MTAGTALRGVTTTVLYGDLSEIPSDAPTFFGAPCPFTHREMDVIRRLVEGDTRGQVAARLGISPSTVKFHIDNAFHRVGAVGATHLVTICFRAGWVK